MSDQPVEPTAPVEDHDLEIDENTLPEEYENIVDDEAEGSDVEIAKNQDPEADLDDTEDEEI